MPPQTPRPPPRLNISTEQWARCAAPRRVVTDTFLYTLVFIFEKKRCSLFKDIDVFATHEYIKRTIEFKVKQKLTSKYRDS